MVLVDRAFMEGDVVVQASNPRGQSGSVVAVRLTVDVEFLQTKAVEKGVPASRLTSVASAGEWAVQGGWLGHVQETDIQVTVLFADGAVCVVRPQMLCWVEGGHGVLCTQLPPPPACSAGTLPCPAR